jgi:hypothetical protein
MQCRRVSYKPRVATLHSSTSTMRPMYKCFGVFLAVSLALFFGLFFGLNYPGNIQISS